MPLGIGLAAARYLIDHSHNVVVLARGKEALEKLHSEYPKQVRAVAGDMADFSLAQTAVKVAMEEFGQVDGLVINHGTLPPVTTVGNCDIEAWQQNFNVNFFSAVAFVSVKTKLSTLLTGLISTGQGCTPFAQKEQWPHCLYFFWCSHQRLWELGSIRVFESSVESSRKDNLNRGAQCGKHCSQTWRCRYTDAKGIA